jgi:DNA-binding HxlR family transcriptional regulator
MLVIRDLGTGPQRFTDLVDRLHGITPKTLTQRLRDLEADGLVTADRVLGRREVWYRLTEAGESLGPALEELLAWGLRFAIRQPKPGEPTHPEHLLWALRVQLDRHAPTTRPTRRLFRVVDDGTYLLSSDAAKWHLVQSDPGASADVVLTTTRAGLARFLTTPGADRDPARSEIEFVGNRIALKAFMKAIAVFPFGSATASGVRDTAGA